MTDVLERLDLLDLDDELDAESRLLRDTVRKFADDRLRPHIRDWFESGELPARELAQEFGALGVLGMHLHGYGCHGATATQYGIACTEIEAVDSGLRSLVSVQGSLAMYAIYAYGSEEQKQRWLPAMANGDALGCFGLTEADSGSDPGSMRTRAVRDGDDWILNGTQDVDHERLDRRCRRRLGAHRGRHPRLPGRAGYPGVRRAGRPPQAVVARIGDQHA